MSYDLAAALAARRSALGSVARHRIFIQLYGQLHMCSYVHLWCSRLHTRHMPHAPTSSLSPIVTLQATFLAAMNSAMMPCAILRFSA